jgi:hypothetical protein
MIFLYVNGAEIETKQKNKGKNVQLSKLLFGN